MNSWMHLRYWSSVGLLPAKGPGWPGGASASRISSAMRARRSLGDAQSEGAACAARRPAPPPPAAPRPPPRPPRRQHSQRDDVGVCLLDGDAQSVLLLLVQGVLVSTPLQEQADLTEGRRGRVGAGPADPGTVEGREGPLRLTRCGPAAWRGAAARAPGCLFGSRPPRFAGGIHRRARSPGEPGALQTAGRPLGEPPAPTGRSQSPGEAGGPVHPPPERA